jgi:hypothetical protein
MYNSNVIFELKSSTLKPGADAEVGEVAKMVNLLPETDIDVEVTLDTNGSQTNSRELQQGRVMAVKDALLGKGVDASRIQTTIHRDSRTLGSEDTVSVKLIDRLMGSFRQTQACYKNESQYNPSHKNIFSPQSRWGRRDSVSFFLPAERAGRKKQYPCG